MGHAVIPAPAQFDAGGGPGFAFRPATVVAYADTGIAPIHGNRAPDEPSVTIQLAATNELDGLPAPVGLSPAGGDPAGERYSLVIEDARIVLRAAERAGVARGLTTLTQLVATAPSSGADEIRVPG